jgi:hypothetical protein
MRQVIAEVAPNHHKYQARLTDYNNGPTVSFADMQKCLGLVEERLARRVPEAAPGK